MTMRDGSSDENERLVAWREIDQINEYIKERGSFGVRAGSYKYEKKEK